MKKILVVLVTACIVVGLWFGVSALLMPKYMTDIKEGALIAEYYEEEKDHDVVFIGDCEVYENFSPVTLWEEYGINSYIRGSAQQLIWQSYYLMEETFRYETPDVMVFNVLSMKYDTPASTGSSAQREAYNRMTLDGMRWSASKWNSIQASMTDEEREKEAQWTYLLPLLRYHDRWSELSKEDFAYWFSRDTVSDNGYLMQVGVKPVMGEYPVKPLVDYTLAPQCYEYLDKMRTLCESNGTQLVLVKAPTLSPIWYEEWDAQVEAYAKQHGLLYLNLLENTEEVGINWDTDTYDRGLHLNVYGAEKLSVYFGKILKEQCGLADRRNESDLVKTWEQKSEVYYARKRQLEAERDAKTEE